MKLFLGLLFSLFYLQNSYSQQIETPPLEARVPFSIVEKTPIYPGCKNNTTVENKICTRDAIHDFLKLHFNKNLLRPRHKKVGIHFLITKSGDLAEISAANSSRYLEKEIIRIVSLLPKMEPGEHRGKQVGVLFGTILDYSSKKKS
ncbi:MAG: hypothetical protein KTR22_14685 [Flavobacteriaceae bacterium]|nr:hypothetical protein [Flavobacteriaceae bacterium]